MQSCTPKALVLNGYTYRKLIIHFFTILFGQYEGRKIFYENLNHLHFFHGSLYKYQSKIPKKLKLQFQSRKSQQFASFNI